jgi:hypothetical protein
MGRHTGKNGMFKIGSDTILDLRGFDITETVSDSDTTACGDAAANHETLTTSFSGSVDVLHNSDDTVQSVRAGDVIAFQGYTEGNASGREVVSGSATVTEVGRSMTYNSEVTKKISIKGRGALSIDTVA